MKKTEFFCYFSFFIFHSHTMTVYKLCFSQTVTLYVVNSTYFHKQSHWLCGKLSLISQSHSDYIVKSNYVHKLQDLFKMSVSMEHVLKCDQMHATDLQLSHMSTLSSIPHYFYRWELAYVPCHSQTIMCVHSNQASIYTLPHSTRYVTGLLTRTSTAYFWKSLIGSSSKLYFLSS